MAHAVPGSSTSDHGEPKQKPKYPRLVRLLGFAVGLVGLLAVLYLVAINVFLSTALFAKVVDAHPETIDIHFARAWSILPRHIHAKRLSIRGRDSNVEWLLTLDEVEFDVSFLALLRQRFEASHVHGTGLAFRFRQRLKAAPSSPEELANLAPIAGLPAYSIRPPKTASADLWNDAAYHLWTVHLEDVRAEDVRELWIDKTRFEGSARIDGRFYLKPLRAVEIGPAHIAVAHGQVSTAKGPVAQAFEGSILDVTVARFDPRTAAGGDILHGVSLVCDAHMVLPPHGGLPLPVGVTIHGPVEVRNAAMHVTSGRLEKDSQLILAAPNVVVNAGKHRVTGALALDSTVAPAPTDGHDRLTFRAEMTEVVVAHELHAKGAWSTLVRAPKVVATGDSSALDIAHPFEDLHFVIEMPDGQLPNARELSRYIPVTAPVSIADGHANAEGRFEVWLADRRATGRARLRAQDLDLGLAKVRVRGATSIRTEFASYHFDSRRLERATLALEVVDGVLASAAAPDTPLVHMTTARLTARAPSVDLDDPLRTLSVSISMPSADIVSRGLLHAYLPKGSEMQIASSRSRFSLDCDIAIAEHLAQGSLDIRSPELTVFYRNFQLDAQVRTHGRVHQWRWETGDLALDEARIDVDDLTISKIGAADRHAAAAMSIARIGVVAKSPRFGFEDPLAEVALSAFVVDGRVGDFTAINAFLPNEATFQLEGQKGSFSARIDLDVEDHIARGSLRARASNMGAGNSTVHLTGDVGLSADFSDWNLKHNTLTLIDSSVEMTRVTGRFGPPGPPSLSAGRILVATRTPLFDIAHPELNGADFHVVVDNGGLPDARAFAPLLPSGGVLGIEGGAAHVAADLTVSTSRHAASGGVDIGIEHGSVRLHTAHLSGNFRFLARISGFDPERAVLDLSGTRLEMRDVAVTGASAATSQWTGNLGFSRASLHLAPNVLLDGFVSINARDARPVLAILFGNDLSGLLVGLTDMPRLVATLELVAAARELALLDLDAHGGDLALRGSYAVREGHRRGAIVARKSFLSLGLRVDDGGSHVRFFGLKAWLRKQGCAARDLLGMPSAACPSRPAAHAAAVSK
jgi:hypothetical protein